MPAGPNEQRLREYLEPARTWQVYMAQRKWHDGAEHLKKVADAVQNARPLARENLGTYTADAADTAFVAMHDKVLARHQQMKDGDTALGEAMEAIQRAEAVRNGFDAVGPLSEPSAPAYDDDEVRQIQQMTVHKAQVGLYNDRAADREEAAAAAIRDLDRTNTTSAEAMRKIQGERPDVPGGGCGGGGGGGLLPGGGRNPTRGPGPRLTNQPTNPPTNSPTNPPTNPPTNLPTNLPTSPPPQETGTPLGPGTGSTTLGTPGSLASPGVTGGSGNIGGVAGAVGGGLAGGAMGMGGAIRSGIGSAAAPGGATRGIGSSGRTGSSGALGRAAAAGSTAGRAAGAGSTAGRAASAGGAAGAGAGAGGRGQAGSKAGGCGAPGGADGRGGRKNQDDKSQRIDAIIDDQDWVDDEDAAPGVIS